MKGSIKSDHVVRVAAWMIILSLLLTLMILGQQLLIPLTWALVFAFILFPACDWMEEKGIGRTWSSLIATVLFTILSGVILFYLVYQSVRILQQEGAVYGTLKDAFENSRNWFYEKLGLEIFHPDEGAQIGTDSLGQILNFAAREISSIGKNIVTITLIPMFLFFLLLYRGIATKFTRSRYEGKRLEQLENFFTRSEYSIQNYLLGTLILTGVTSAMAFVILLLFGVKYAFFFSIFIGILNLIPYIGNLAAFVVVLLFVYVTKQDIGITIFCGLALYAANLIQENVLRPKLVGDKMEMNAMVVFTAVIVGGMIWGFSGMVLLIPLLGILKSLFDSDPDLQVYAILFESDADESPPEDED